MKTTLLLIPTKKTDDVNWTKPLNNYLLSIYGNTSEYQQDLTSFNKLRQDIRGANADQTGLKLYFRYFSQLELLDLRIPVATVNKNKKISFTWYDAFLPAAQHKQYALPFEKASVLFNLGSLMSKAASLKYSESHKTSTDDSSFKEALQLLQQAAGVFQFLAENFLHAPSSDLSPSTVKFLVRLCLAQSQEIFNLKVIDSDFEQKKNSLIAKLCLSTANQYEECYNNCDHLTNSESSEQSTFEIVESGLDEEELDFGDENSLDEYNPDKLGIPDAKVTANLDPFWIATVHFKASYYKALSYYFQGLHLEATNKFGDAIAYLTKSMDLINEIPPASLKLMAKSGGEDAYDLLDNYKYQKDALGIKLKDLTKDNDLIYHDIVPSVVTIAEPKPVDSSKVVPMNKIELFAQVNEYNYNHFLKNVVPTDIHELLSFYSEEKSQFLRNELDEVDVSNEELSSVLEYLKLPKALVNIKEIINGNKELGGENAELRLDAEVLGRVAEISSKFAEDVSNRSTVAEVRQKIYNTISESEGTLSGQLGTNSGRFREDLIKLKKSLYDAANSDSRLFALVDAENSQFHAILGKGVNSPQFKSLFTVPDAHGETPKPVEEISLLDVDESHFAKKTDAIDSQITGLEDLLHDLNVIKSNKTKLVANLKEEIHRDDISDILMLNTKVKSNSEIKSVIFPEELKKFAAYGNELDSLIEKQRSLISELKNKWDVLSSNPKVKQVQSSKTYQDELVKQQVGRINTFYENHWRKYSLGLSKGTEFYMQLLKFAENLKRTIESESQRDPLSDRFGGLTVGNTGGSMLSQTHQSNPDQLFFSSMRPDLQQQPQQQFQPRQLYQPQQQLYQPQQQQQQQFQPQQQYQSQAHYQPQLFPPGQQNQQYQNQAYQPQQFQNTNTGGDYSRAAPALPPKRPSQSFQPQGNVNQEQNLPFQQQPPSSTGLIYDEPSTYQPNMYNFFLKQG